MAKALPVELRDRVLTAIRNGATLREAADRFEIGIATAARWRALERRQGDARPKPVGGNRRSAGIDAERGRILRLVEEAPGLTIRELRAALEARGLVFSYGALQRFLKRHRVRRGPRRRRA